MSESTTDGTRTAVETYFRTWRERDFAGFRANLADDVTFEGPMATVDGADAVTWFDLHTKGGDVLAVANWSHVTNGRVDRIRVTFDPRPLLG